MVANSISLHHKKISNSDKSLDKEPLKAIDLFAGIGGIREGFDRAFDLDIDFVFSSEIDINAQKNLQSELWRGS